MTSAQGAIAAAAERLWYAQCDSAPIPPVTSWYPELNVESAYEVQGINLRRQLSAGAHLVGRKVGLTSEPMQTLLGVNEPDFGYILDSMIVGTDTVEIERFCAPRVEPEIAFLLSRPLRGPRVDIEDVYAATEFVAVALEVVDSRIADWKLTLPDTVADNASSGAVVLGEWVPYSAGVNLSQMVATLELNGEQIDTGVGRAVMGDPAAAVAWLANTLAHFDTELTHGQFVMSGAFTAAARVSRGDVVTAEISGLGAASLAFR